MTDRAQPGAIKSLARNDELAQVLGQLTGGFDDGWVADPADPTPSSTRRGDINESAFDGFALSGVSSSSLSVDVGPGEAFAGGWFVRDTSTTVSLPTNTTSTIVAAMDLDAVYDPQNDPDRDAADRVVIDAAASVSDDLPRVRLHDVTTDGSGVTGTTDLRKPYGPALEAESATVNRLDIGNAFLRYRSAGSYLSFGESGTEEVQFFRFGDDRVRYNTDLSLNDNNDIEDVRSLDSNNITATNATVDNPPSQNNDVARKKEVDEAIAFNEGFAPQFGG